MRVAPPVLHVSMNIQTHRNSTQKALSLGTIFKQLITLIKYFFNCLFPVRYCKGQSACASHQYILTLFFPNNILVEN